ncbi:FK506-binding protein 15-like isoform X2 [Neodiprion virginianus]|uniref:FK506-binding protein 15-like isoform X2 n=1 Tax=Neodiprion virginianus TaxID=2961670 RepID=UPI001EE771DB|nr:FK506-binding protein 15-like isoform X2 [Neodiprion virginianus]
MNNRAKMSGTSQLSSANKMFKEMLEDDDDFTSPAGSNLAAIFNTSQNTQENARNSPSRLASVKQSISDQSQSKKEVILAKAVYAFKLQNGQYVSIGKVGIALTGNVLAKQYDIILYKGTQNYLSVAAITPDFIYTVQDHNYASYYDTNKNNWSILFGNKESSIQFAREVCLSTYFSRPVRIDNNVIYQDLNAPMEVTSIAKEGDGISMKYITSVDMAQPLKMDMNLKQTITLEISKDDNWERLLIGTSIGLRRMIILPSSKQIGLGPSFPKDKEIIMEIEVVSILAKAEPLLQTTKTPDVSQKATIISRMAKMGQSILPKLPTSTTTDSEDTEEEVFHKTTRHKRVESTESTLPVKHSYSKPSLDAPTQKKILNRGELMSSTLSIATQRPVMSASTLATQWTPSQIQQYVSIDGQLLPVQQQTIAQPIPPSMDPSLNVFLSETRTQNTELRMGLAKIGDNVQKLLDKFHVLELQQASTPATDKSLEATLKMLIDINRSKENVECKERDVQSTSQTEGTQRNRNLITTTEQLNSKLNTVEDELKQATELLNDKSLRITELNRDNDVLKQTNSALKNRIEELEKDLISSQSKVATLSDKCERFKDAESKYQAKNSELENFVTELTSKCKGLEENMWKSETNNWVDKSKELKEIMTEMLEELYSCFTEDQYATDHVKSVIYKTMKSITLRIVREEEEKKKEKVKSKKDTDAPVSKSDISGTFKENEPNTKFARNDNNYKDSEELSLPAISSDSVNFSPTHINTVSESGTESPPVPKFDVEAIYQ